MAGLATGSVVVFHIDFNKWHHEFQQRYYALAQHSPGNNVVSSQSSILAIREKLFWTVQNCYYFTSIPWQHFLIL